MNICFSSMVLLLAGVVISAEGTLEEECNILMKLDSLETRVQEQETSLLKQDERITQQAVSLAEKDTRIGDLERSIVELESSLAEKITRTELEASLSQQAVEISELGNTLNSTLIEHENELVNLEQRLRPVQAVGFTAKYPLTSQTASNQMAFKTVVTNEGGAFNAVTGVFTCPVAGYYYFNAAFVKNYSHDGGASCYIYKNGHVLVAAYTLPEPSPRAGHYAAVNGVYTRLAVNDTVTLGGCRTPIETVFYELSSFTGYLVSPDD